MMSGTRDESERNVFSMMTPETCWENLLAA
jgi:hypothetical protein